MEIIALPIEDEWPHQPGSVPLWQESIVLTWQDIGQSIGGFIRIGQHPNRALGICTFGIVEKGGIGFNHSSADIPLKPTDRFENGFAIGDFLRVEFAKETSRWTAHDANCDFDLTVTNIHPLYDTWALVGLNNRFREKFAASHTEVAGLIQGTIRLGDRHWTINGFGYRDHSWGVRDHSDPSAQLVNLFWLVGSFGKDLVVCACETIAASAARFNTGFVIQNGEVDRPIVSDISFTVDADGISTRGSRCVLDTNKFGKFDLEIEGFGNVILGMQGDTAHATSYFECGMPSRMRWNGREGGLHVSTMFNARGASRPPALLYGISLQQGIYAMPKWTASSSLNEFRNARK